MSVISRLRVSVSLADVAGGWLGIPPHGGANLFVFAFFEHAVAVLVVFGHDRIGRLWGGGGRKIFFPLPGKRGGGRSECSRNDGGSDETMDFHGWRRI